MERKLTFSESLQRRERGMWFNFFWLLNMRKSSASRMSSSTQDEDEVINRGFCYEKYKVLYPLASACCFLVCLMAIVT